MKNMVNTELEPPSSFHELYLIRPAIVSLPSKLKIKTSIKEKSPFNMNSFYTHHTFIGHHFRNYSKFLNYYHFDSIDYHVFENNLFFVYLLANDLLHVKTLKIDVNILTLAHFSLYSNLVTGFKFADEGKNIPSISESGTSIDASKFFKFHNYHHNRLLDITGFDTSVVISFFRKFERIVVYRDTKSMDFGNLHLVELAHQSGIEVSFNVEHGKNLTFSNMVNQTLLIFSTYMKKQISGEIRIGNEMIKDIASRKIFEIPSVDESMKSLGYIVTPIIEDFFGAERLIQDNILFEKLNYELVQYIKLANPKQRTKLHEYLRPYSRKIKRNQFDEKYTKLSFIELISYLVHLVLQIRKDSEEFYNQADTIEDLVFVVECKKKHKK
jgi:hypothetical protein